MNTIGRYGYLIIIWAMALVAAFAGFAVSFLITSPIIDCIVQAFCIDWNDSEGCVTPFWIGPASNYVKGLILAILAPILWIEFGNSIVMRRRLTPNAPWPLFLAGTAFTIFLVFRAEGLGFAGVAIICGGITARAVHRRNLASLCRPDSKNKS